MKQQKRINDLKFILDMINSARSSQNSMSRALINNDLADFFKSLSLLSNNLTMLMDLLNKDIERLEKEESAGDN